jgi:hypothetical protein
MSYARQVELEEHAAGRKRPEEFADATLAPPIAPALEGPAARRPDAVLARQAVLGNAHVGRVFRSPAEAPAPGDGSATPEEKQDCNCPDKENCSCAK